MERKRLSLKVAREVAIKVVGTADTYRMELGLVSLVIQYSLSGNIMVSIRTLGDIMHLFFNPETLEEDCYEEESFKKLLDEGRLRDWVESAGPEVCKSTIDYLWSGIQWSPTVI